MAGDFRIGNWLIQPELNRIGNAHQQVRLEPKVMGVLVYLARHAGAVLSKERIIQAVWPDAFVTDDVLIHAISEIRKAFQEDGKDSKLIETIPRRGYRLVAEPAFEPADRHKPAHLWQKISAGLALAAVAAALWFTMGRDRSRPDPGIGPKLVAVLPLRGFPSPDRR